MLAQSRVSRAIKLWASALLALLLVACAGGRLDYHYPVVSDAAPGQSVRVVPSAGPRHIVDANNALTPLFRQALAKKGYAEAAEQAQLELVYEVRTGKVKTVELTPVVTAAGTHQRTEFHESLRGAIVITMFEVGSGKPVYTASTSGEIGEAGVTDAQLRQIVAGLMKKLPAVAR